MKSTGHSFIRRGAASVAVAGVLLAVPAAAAYAHVTINPNTASAGDYATLTVKVPTEKANASTTKLEIDLPTDHPFTSVSYQPVPGWSAVVTTAKLAKPVTTDDGTITEAPTKIVWTASKGAAIKPQQFQQFPISVGAVPNVKSLSFVAVQTYSDGSVVKWDQPTKAGQPEPEHPAPVLTVGAASNTATDAPTVAAAAPKSQTNDSDKGVWFGVAGMAVGVGALLVALYAATRRSR